VARGERGALPLVLFSTPLRGENWFQAFPRELCNGFLARVAERSTRVTVSVARAGLPVPQPPSESRGAVSAPIRGWSRRGLSIHSIARPSFAVYVGSLGLDSSNAPRHEKPIEFPLSSVQLRSRRQEHTSGYSGSVNKLYLPLN